MDKIDKNIVFFDGHCGLCNGFVDFVLKHDTKGIFYFSPLQSDFAKRTVPESYITDLKSVVVHINGETFMRARAVFQVLRKLGSPIKVLSIFSLLPDSILNVSYDLVATNRYRIFGKRETCRLPGPSERARFIL
jgi:prepilin-type processing-associated H-X9-DG protein